MGTSFTHIRGQRRCVTLSVALELGFLRNIASSKKSRASLIRVEQGGERAVEWTALVKFYVSACGGNAACRLLLPVWASMDLQPLLAVCCSISPQCLRPHYGNQPLLRRARYVHPTLAPRGSD